jgi:hypothetical protein
LRPGTVIDCPRPFFKNNGEPGTRNVWPRDILIIRNMDLGHGSMVPGPFFEQ